MIDLDSMEGLLASYKTDSNLYIIFGSWLCKGKISYVEFQKLSKWTSVYHYALPHERDILPELSDYLYRISRYNLFGLALLVSHIKVNFTLEQQMLLLQHLEESPAPSMEKLPENCGTLTPNPFDF